MQLEAWADSEPDPDTQEFLRYAVDYPDTKPELEPRLGDRPYVVSPAQPLFLLAGQESVLYVSAIVRIRVKTGDGSGNVLLDMPTKRMS